MNGILNHWFDLGWLVGFGLCAGIEGLVENKMEIEDGFHDHNALPSRGCNFWPIKSQPDRLFRTPELNTMSRRDAGGDERRISFMMRKSRNLDENTLWIQVEIKNRNT